MKKETKREEEGEKKQLKSTDHTCGAWIWDLLLPNVCRRQTAEGMDSLHKENKLIALKQAHLSNTTNYPWHQQC